MKIVLLLFLFANSLFAIISIVPVEVGEKPGVHGEAGISLSTKRGNSDTDNYKGALRITYDTNATYVTWAQISGEYDKANGEKNIQKSYLHLRYIHNLTSKYQTIELFAQSQEDAFRLIKRRRLAGAGYRGRFLHKQRLKFFIGAGGFYEYIGYTSNDPKETNTRFNFYTAFSYTLNEKSKINFVSYYQPKVDEWSDFVTSNKLSLRFHLIEKLFLNVSVSYDYDAKPPLEVKKEDLYQDTAFLYQF